MCTSQGLTFMEAKKYLKMTMSKTSNQSIFHSLSVGYMLDHVGLSQCTLNSGVPSTVRIALPIWKMNHPKLRITPFLISMVTTSVALLNRIMTQSLTLTGKTGSLTPYSICVRFLFHVFAPTPWKINMERTNHPFKRKMIFQAVFVDSFTGWVACLQLKPP